MAAVPTVPAPDNPRWQLAERVTDAVRRRFSADILAIGVHGTLAHGDDPAASVNMPPSADPLAEHPRYRILERIGVGGMGVVYKAQHLLMERMVALKVIHRRLTEKPAMGWYSMVPGTSAAMIV